MLTQTLRELERDGIVQRTVYPVIPPRVEYALTPLGRTLTGPLDASCAWVYGNFDAVQEARSRYRPVSDLVDHEA